MKLRYKIKFLFYLLQKYWTIKYFFKIFIINSENYFHLTKSQFNNQENIFISDLSKSIKSKNFIEIGYHYRELNCIGLIQNNFFGKIVDADMGDTLNTFIMKILIKKVKRKIDVIKRFINLENIDDIFDMKKLGCLSIDIDGNEYWILEKILSKNIIPEVIITEYNASFLDHEITVPYDKNFNIHKKHPSLWYHGASLFAFNKLLNKYQYGLVKVIGGTNAIFIQEELLKASGLKKFDPSEIYEECESRNKKGGNSAKEQFDAIKHLPLVKV
tara:strand:+ start:492 stop:1307 length:816 start_codon:yes stop_codon:yes gene_type:complete